MSLVKGLGMTVNTMTGRWEREMFCDEIRNSRQCCVRSVLLRIGSVIPMSLVKGLGMTVNTMTGRWEREMFCDDV